MNTLKFAGRILLALILVGSFGKYTIDRPSEPILILATHIGFGTYTAEIMKAEGYNEFCLDSVTSRKFSVAYLRQFDHVVLGECKPEKKEKEILMDYVRGGGNLIVFRPDSTFDEIFGIEFSGKQIIDGYIEADHEAAEGTGIASGLMQFHGEADLCAVTGGRALASLFTRDKINTGSPAVVSHDIGEGHAVAFLYNLPKSIVLTRQGNPEYAGLEKDGIPGLRGMDLFTDGWIDTSMNTINQADQQMALLTNCIRKLSKYTKPLPRFWYFPDTLKCLAVLDNDGEDNFEADFEPQFRDVDSMGAKMTIYLKDVDKVSKEWVERWTAKGFEIAGHPDDTREAGNPVWEHMDSAILSRSEELKTRFGISVRTNVNHWFLWCGRDSEGRQDFGAQARLEEKHGIEMDANYAIYDINSNQQEHYLGTLGYHQGNFTGSGLVMKYADASGKTVNVYQRFNAVYDQQYNEGSTAGGFFDCFRGLVDRSLYDDIYSIVSIKAHNNEYYFSKEPLMRMLAYANSKGIPVWTALSLLDFLKMKDEASFTDIAWMDNQLSFVIKSGLHHSYGLTFLVPSEYWNRKVVKLTRDGEEIPIFLKTIKGTGYAFVTIQGGEDYKITVFYE